METIIKQASANFNIEMLLIFRGRRKAAKGGVLNRHCEHG